jgi:hypothetical protein
MSLKGFVCGEMHLKNKTGEDLYSYIYDTFVTNDENYPLLNFN